jgi:hypothetical protein
MLEANVTALKRADRALKAAIQATRQAQVAVLGINVTTLEGEDGSSNAHSEEA